MTKKYKAVKYPRVIVSNKRHRELSLEANLRGISVETLAEEKFRNSNRIKSPKVS